MEKLNGRGRSETFCMNGDGMHTQRYEIILFSTIHADYHGIVRRPAIFFIHHVKREMLKLCYETISLVEISSKNPHKIRVHKRWKLAGCVCL